MAMQVENYFDLEEFGFTCDADTELADPFVVAPNPNNGNFFIVNNSPNIFQGNILITDVTGKTVYFEQKVFMEKRVQKYYKLPGLSGGIYFVKYYDSHRSYVQPMLVY